MTRPILLSTLLLVLAACDSGGTLDSAEDSRDAPLAPGLLLVQDSDANSVTLSWRDQSEFETGFEIERTAWNSGAEVPTEGFEVIDSVSENATSYTDFDLAGASRWVYRIRPTGGTSEPSEVLVVQPRALARIAPADAEVIGLTPSAEDVLMVGEDGRLRLYDAASGALRATADVAGTRFAAGDGCYASNLGSELTVLDADLNPRSTIAENTFILEFSLDCSRVLVVPDDNRVEPVIYDAATGQEITKVPSLVPGVVVGDRALNPDGTVLFGRSPDNSRVEAKSATDGGTIWSVTYPSGVNRVAYADGQVLVSIDGQDEIVVLDPQTGAELSTWPVFGGGSPLQVGGFIHRASEGVVTLYQASDYAVARTLIPYGTDGQRLQLASRSVADGPRGLRVALALTGGEVVTYDLNDGWEAFSSAD